MRSVVVVFPASMWAMMPMFRILSSGVVRGIAVLYSAKTRGDLDAHAGPVSLRHHRRAFGSLDAGSLSAGSRSCRSRRLPPVMRESAIRFRHPVRVFLLLNRLALALRGENELGGEALRHRFFLARTAVLDQPAHPQRRAPLRPYLDRHLIRGSAHAPRLHFQRRLAVRQRLLEHVHAGLPRTLLDQIHRRIEDPLRQRLLALRHQVIEKLRDGLAVVARIGRHRSLYRLFATAHFAASLGRLAPYLDRDCLRSFTPAASSVPRMM